MGFSKKTGKGRLDKYYFLAKDQGYRARSAFKLVQLNKKYGILDQSRVVIDLCAAPGGWLQVAAKYMPASHVIVGVDLVPIKPINNVTTIVADITTDKCRSELKRELKGWKADVVLHDGAPNVGKSWLHDAYSQSELVLHSLKLATEFLIKDGSFVTKVFRSKDYNSLMWVFNQLFNKVEATKPASSRDVSAEIFVVCRGFKAPDRIDPRLLDPKSVFEEISLLQKGAAGMPSASGRLNLEHPEKQARHRSGYEDGITMLYKELPVQDFIYSSEQNVLLATCNRLVFDKDTDPRIISLADRLENKDSIRALCEDLKVLGHREFKILTKWRKAAREALGIIDSVPVLSSSLQVTGMGESVRIEEMDMDRLQSNGEMAVDGGNSDPLAELDEISRKLKKAERRQKSKALERKARQRMRMQAEMGNVVDLADDITSSERLFTIKPTNKEHIVDSDSEDGIDREDVYIAPGAIGQDSEDDSMDADEDEGLITLSDSDDGGVSRWEETLERDYAIRKGRLLKRDPVEMVKAERIRIAEEIESDIESDEDCDFDQRSSINSNFKENNTKSKNAKGLREINSDEDGERPMLKGLNVSMMNKEEEKKELESRMESWYSNPVFRQMEEDLKSLGGSNNTCANGGVGGAVKNGFRDGKDIDQMGIEAESSKKKLAKMKNAAKLEALQLKSGKNQKNKKSKDGKSSKNDLDDKSTGQIVFVKAEHPQSEDDEDFGSTKKSGDIEADTVINEGVKKSVLTASGMTLAAKFAADQKRARKDIIDDSFNRYSFPDEGPLPRWFTEDESKHNKPEKSITKEGIALLRAKQREIDARPIKKVLEAKGRNRRRVEKKIEALKQKAAVIANSEDMGERQKSEQIQKMLAKGSRPQKKETRLVIARGGSRGVKGRPKGVKGHYKMVDSRLKKDMRAQKRNQKKAPSARGRKPQKG